MIKITARNYKLTNGIKETVNEKLSKFEKFLTSDGRIEVVLESNKYGQEIEVFFMIEETVLKAECTDEDLYVAIDLVVDKLDTQVRRHNDKNNGVTNESIRYADFSSPVDNDDKEGLEPKIVKRKYITSKPMFEEEAISQMEVLNHKSFLFFNASTETFCMLYKRHDGNYGIIETE